jgi:hypothetical protein
MFVGDLVISSSTVIAVSFARFADRKARRMPGTWRRARGIAGDLDREHSDWGSREPGRGMAIASARAIGRSEAPGHPPKLPGIARQQA